MLLGMGGLGGGMPPSTLPPGPSIVGGLRCPPWAR